MVTGKMPAPQGIFGYFFNWKSLRLLSYPMYCLVKPFSTSQIHHQQLILTLFLPIQAEYRFFSISIGWRSHKNTRILKSSGSRNHPNLHPCS